MLTKTHLLIFCVCYAIVIECIFAYNYLEYTAYQFKRYPYKKKQKNERRIKNAKNLCETQHCQNMYGLELLKCLRQCMNKDCYDEIYAQDELEEGEIDVRYNSFKGCVLQNIPRN